MTPLRFCMLTTFYPPYHFGGDAIGVQRLARGLVRAGHDVTVVHDVDAYHALHPGAPPNDGEAADGVEVIPLRSGLRTLSPLLTQQTGRPIVHGRAIRRLMAERRFDVVNFHNVSLIGGPGILSYGGQAVRVYMAHEHWLVCPTHVLWRHGRELCSGRQCIRCSIAYRRPPQLWRATKYLERQLDHVDLFVAMSEFSRDKHKEFGFPREMEVLPCFLSEAGTSIGSRPDTDRPHARPYFLFVGRLERIKGLDDVIPAFERFDGADLLVAGDGEHAERLRQLAGGNPRIRFLGRLAPEALRPYYDHALAVIVPSVCFETFGITLIEAFRQGTPVIARRIGPFPEIVERAGAGILFSTTEELVAGLDRFATDTEFRARAAQAGRRAYEEHWSERVVIPAYLDLVWRAAERKRRVSAVAAHTRTEVA
jgi:glycosyltransferase involved in cell wall biosynthesis